MMFKSHFILSAILLSFIFLEVAHSTTYFNIVTNNKEFRPTTDLLSEFTQKNKDNEIGGYHRAEVYFKTTVPSINPDQSNVKSIECNDGNKITLNLDDENAIKNVNSWPNKVMLLVSHKWNCFNKRANQFFMAKSKTIDVPNKKVTFITEGCDISDFAKNFAVDLSWVEGRKIRRNRNKLNKRVPFPSIDKSAKLDLNVLFDQTTGKSSKPNLPIISNPDISLLCTECFMKGEATISLKIDGSISFSGISLDDATISLNGNALMNLDLLLNGTIAKTFTSNNQLLSVPVPGFPNAPGLFTIGPSIDLTVSSTFAANLTGSVSFGGDVSLPNFNANASFVNITQPKFSQSGFNPQSNLHKPQFTFSDASADISGAIKPQLAFGINILDGKFEQKVGFEIVGSLDNNISFGKQAACVKKTQPRLKTNLNGNLGFFVNDNDFPIVNFPSLTLFDKCL
ncbi:hypothetical protein RclHR1_02720010 [Rhizophagus clarus]|uniref:Apple protein n=1 Tax=Rhizophagus clarus TaxID=94130 RepID=A0A2Z6R2V2_9GLOM|nr:hypothetical protein RclHR1_02720010 [Rhizophagus clarus]GES80775.1 apple protein [Rhizophagus clarus]